MNKRGWWDGVLCGLSASSFWQTEHLGDLFCFCISLEMCANKPNFASQDNVPPSAVAISECCAFFHSPFCSSELQSQLSGLQGHLCSPASGPLHVLSLQQGPGMLLPLSPFWRTLNDLICSRTLATSSLNPMDHKPCTPTAPCNKRFLPWDASVPCMYLIMYIIPVCVSPRGELPIRAVSYSSLNPEPSSLQRKGGP